MLYKEHVYESICEKYPIHHVHPTNGIVGFYTALGVSAVSRLTDVLGDCLGMTQGDLLVPPVAQAPPDTNVRTFQGHPVDIAAPAPIRSAPRT